MTENKKTKVKQHDALRDDYIDAFRACKIRGINRKSLNDYSVLYVKKKVGIQAFSQFIEGERETEEGLNIVDALEKINPNAVIEADTETDETDVDEEE